jgi:phosphogluconate dehydratase
MISRIRNGDEILLDAQRGVLSLQVDDAELEARTPAGADPRARYWGLGSELFDGFSARVSGAEQGATSIYTEEPAYARVSQEAPVHEH